LGYKSGYKEPARLIESALAHLDLPWSGPDVGRKAAGRERFAPRIAQGNPAREELHRDIAAAPCCFSNRGAANIRIDKSAGEDIASPDGASLGTVDDTLMKRR
jgi:hypothetical protein